MNNPNFNQEQYESYLQQMLDKGIPITSATEAAFVIANDNPGAPNLGRSEEDSKKVQDAFTWYQAKETSNSNFL